MIDDKVLTKEEISSHLVSKLSGWTYTEDKISKEFVFKDFLDAISFIQKITPYFQQVDHHPDIHIHYKRILFELNTKSAGSKVTEKDIEAANTIEREYSKF